LEVVSGSFLDVMQPLKKSPFILVGGNGQICQIDLIFNIITTLKFRFRPMCPNCACMVLDLRLISEHVLRECRLCFNTSVTLTQTKMQFVYNSSYTDPCSLVSVLTTTMLHTQTTYVSGSQTFLNGSSLAKYKISQGSQC